MQDFYILYRPGTSSFKADEAEIVAAQQAGFKITYFRTEISSSSLIVPRYSSNPFFNELVIDTMNLGSQVINSISQYNYVNNLQNWVYSLGNLTPETWDRLEDLPENTSFVLKGENNSLKHYWKEAMFASNKQEAIRIHSLLSRDSLIGHQKIYIRKYYPLKTYCLGIQDLPITHEFRFFVCRGKIFAGGYYWHNYVDELPEVPDITSVPLDFLKTVVAKVNNQVNFYSLDVAQTVEERWIVVELNDGQSSGLTTIDPLLFYQGLYQVLKDKYV